MLILIFIAVILSIILINYNQQDNGAKDNGAVFFKGLQEQKVTGLQIPGCCIIIKTKGRSIEAINKTIHHEVLHELIKYDYKHFCEVQP